MGGPARKPPTCCIFATVAFLSRFTGRATRMKAPGPWRKCQETWCGDNLILLAFVSFNSNVKNVLLSIIISFYVLYNPIVFNCQACALWLVACGLVLFPSRSHVALDSNSARSLVAWSRGQPRCLTEPAPAYLTPGSGRFPS